MNRSTDLNERKGKRLVIKSIFLKEYISEINRVISEIQGRKDENTTLYVQHLKNLRRAYETELSKSIIREMIKEIRLNGKQV